MKKLLLVFALVIVAMVIVRSWSNEQPISAGKSEPLTQLSPPPTQEHIHTQEYAVKGRVPAHYAKAPNLVR